MPIFWKLRAKLHHWFGKVLGLAFILLIVVAVIWGRDLLISMWRVVESYM